jgi:hypothetical protein
MYSKMLSGESLAIYNDMIDRAAIPAGIESVEKRVNTRARRERMIATLSVAASIAVCIILVTRDFEKAPLPEVHDEPPVAIAGAMKVVLSVRGETVELTEQDHETTWQKRVDSLPGVPEENDAPARVKIEVPRGMEYRLRLPDSTQVWLNAETVMEFPKEFTGEKRSVILSGEAYFDVARHPGTPFEISTRDRLEITVLGTKFNVNSYADAGSSVVTLVEGSLKVGSDFVSKILKPREQAVFDRAEGGLTVTEVSDMRTYTAWTEGQFYYRSSPPDVLFSALERWYDVDIVLDGSELSVMGSITLMFSRKDSLTTILDALHALTGCKYRVDDKTIYITL